jgi:hypothetical protein
MIFKKALVYIILIILIIFSDIFQILDIAVSMKYEPNTINELSTHMNYRKTILLLHILLGVTITSIFLKSKPFYKKSLNNHLNN